LREMTPLPLVQLLEHEIGDVACIAQYAHGIGIAKTLVTPAAVAEAHAQGLAVHAWTFRAENEFLPHDLKVGKSPAAHGDLRGEIARYLAFGIDGFFTDFPAIGVTLRDAWAG
jgi:glycerophosphoryl diester phosphodiesterase